MISKIVSNFGKYADGVLPTEGVVGMLVGKSEV